MSKGKRITVTIQFEVESLESYPKLNSKHPYPEEYAPEAMREYDLQQARGILNGIYTVARNTVVHATTGNEYLTVDIKTKDI